MEAQLEQYLVGIEGGDEVIEARRRERKHRDTEAAAAIREEDRLMYLERAGEAKRGTGTLADDFWNLPMPEDPEASVRRALEEDRG